MKVLLAILLCALPLAGQHRKWIDLSPDFREKAAIAKVELDKISCCTPSKVAPVEEALESAAHEVKNITDLKTFSQMVAVLSIDEMLQETSISNPIWEALADAKTQCDNELEIMFLPPKELYDFVAALPRHDGPLCLERAALAIKRSTP